MKLSVFYHHIKEAALQEKISRDEVFKKLYAAGIEFAELDFDDILKNPQMKEELVRNHFKVSSIYAFFDFGCKEDKERAQALIRTAVDFECQKIMVVPGFYHAEDVSGRQAQRERMAEAVGNLCAAAGEKNITVTMEDFDDTLSPIKNCDGLFWFLERIPKLKITFDTGNFIFSGEDALKALEKLRKNIVHVHLKDRSLLKRDENLQSDEGRKAEDGTMLYAVFCGGGFLPMAEIVKRLACSGYDGIYTIEHFGSGRQLEYMLLSAAWVKSCLEHQPAE